MQFHYQVLTTPTGDTPGTTLLLNFPEKRYLFGHVSEGTQRALSENGVKFGHLLDLFVTGRTEWANIGGLLGTVLTLADAHINSFSAVEALKKEKEMHRQANNPKQSSTKPEDEPHIGPTHETTKTKLTIHGGKNLTHTIATARRFIFRKGLPLLTKEYGANTPVPSNSDETDPFEQPSWQDSNIKVWVLPIVPTQQTAAGSTNSGLKSSRKRSLDEFQEYSPAVKTLDSLTKDQITRDNVVSNMFRSTWQMDSLIEMPLANVKMPATIFIRNPETKDLEQYSGPMPGGSEPLPNIKVLVRLPWPAALVEKLPPARRSVESLSYIVRNHDLRGKFDAQKAKDLKVHKGPDYAQLTRGESVVSKDGQTVTPDMVLGPTRPGKGTAFIDLPSSDYVPDLVSRSEWQSPAVTTGLEVFVWLLGPGVGEDPRLQEFIRRMPHCKHVVSSTDYCPNYLAMQSSAGSSIRLAKLNSDNFSIPVHDNVTLPQAGTPTAGSKTITEALQDSSFQPAERGLIINMEPKFEINRSDVVHFFNPATAIQRTPYAVEKRISMIQHRMKKPPFQQRLQELRQDLPGAEAEIITLGTGSSAPSRYRNVSATLLKVPGQGYYLFDCGENTLGQLKRAFPPDELKAVLQNLRMIWISHLHADHHLGTVAVIKAWYNENYGNRTPPTNFIETDMAKILQEKRLFVVSEGMMVGWLEEYAGVEDFGFDKLVSLTASPYIQNGELKTSFIYRHCRADGTYPDSHLPDTSPVTTQLDFDDPLSPLSPLLQSATGLSGILTTFVSHCRGAMAISITFLDGFKVSYSGDCRPSANFAKIGKNTTVLIHEATFQDDMKGSAFAKKHSTTTEALEVGRQMGARMIVLTHFSQRYQKIALLDPQDRKKKRRGVSYVTNDPDGIKELEDTPRLRDVNLSKRDDIALSNQSHSESQRALKLDAPVAIGFDLMRVLVKDIPIAQVYAPAFEKLIDLLERDSVIESEKRRTEHREREAMFKSKKDAKRRRSRSHPRPPSPRETGLLELVVPTEKQRSVWSASESEEGWTTSESEDQHKSIKRAVV